MRVGFFPTYVFWFRSAWFCVARDHHFLRAYLSRNDTTTKQTDESFPRYHSFSDR